MLTNVTVLSNKMKTVIIYIQQSNTKNRYLKNLDNIQKRCPQVDSCRVSLKDYEFQLLLLLVSHILIAQVFGLSYFWRKKHCKLNCVSPHPGHGKNESPIIEKCVKIFLLLLLLLIHN